MDASLREPLEFTTIPPADEGLRQEIRAFLAQRLAGRSLVARAMMSPVR